MSLLQETWQLYVAIFFVRLIAVACRGKLVWMSQNACHLTVRLLFRAEVSTVLHLKVQIDLAIALKDCLLCDFGLVLHSHGHVVNWKREV